MSFNPGQRVVCIDADGAPQLKVKAIYTIKDVIGPCSQRWRGQIIHRGFAIFLYEAEPMSDYVGFAAERFRPIQERQTDISVFTAMLTKVSEDA